MVDEVANQAWAQGRRREPELRMQMRMRMVLRALATGSHGSIVCDEGVQNYPRASSRESAQKRSIKGKVRKTGPRPEAKKKCSATHLGTGLPKGWDPLGTSSSECPAAETPQ